MNIRFTVDTLMMNVQIRDNGSFVARVDRVSRVARCLVQSVVPLEKGQNNDNELNTSRNY